MATSKISQAGYSASLPSPAISAPYKPPQSALFTKYPTPLVIPPTAEHIHTVIMLHGRGDTPRGFAYADGLMGMFTMPVVSPSLGYSIPSGTGWTIADDRIVRLNTALPGVKWVLPGAAPRVAQRFGGRMTQWFDLYSWNLGWEEENEEWMVDGLRESVAWVQRIVEEEAGILGGMERVFLGGLSQGCATAMVTGLLWEGGQRLGGLFGMSGWLPFRWALEEGVKEAQRDASDTGVEVKADDTYKRGVKVLCEKLEWPVPKLEDQDVTAARRIPIWIAHGTEDETVDIELGKRMTECLNQVGMDRVSWTQYQDLTHWFESNELGDLVEWLKSSMEK